MRGCLLPVDKVQAILRYFFLPDLSGVDLGASMELLDSDDDIEPPPNSGHGSTRGPTSQLSLSLFDVFSEKNEG